MTRLIMEKALKPLKDDMSMILEEAPYRSFKDICCHKIKRKVKNYIMCAVLPETEYKEIIETLFRMETLERNRAIQISCWGTIELSNYPIIYPIKIL